MAQDADRSRFVSDRRGTVSDRSRMLDRTGTVSDREPVYVISVAARLVGLHPQTLRQYDRIGLVSPVNTGTRRLYSLRDIRRLQRVIDLTNQGFNLVAVQRLLDLEDEVEFLQAEMRRMRERLARTEPDDTKAIVQWRPRPGH